MSEQASAERNVLLAVDGSEHSQRAFDFYLSDLCKSGDHLIVFHAQEMPTLPAAPYPYFSMSVQPSGFSSSQNDPSVDIDGFAYYEEWQDVMKKVDEEAKALLRHYGDVLKKREDIKFKLVKEGGKPGELIVKNAEDENARMIVLGSRGQGAVRRTFLGSVSDYVAHHAHCAICVVPPEKRH